MEGDFVEWFGIPALTGKCQMEDTGERRRVAYSFVCCSGCHPG